MGSLRIIAVLLLSVWFSQTAGFAQNAQDSSGIAGKNSTSSSKEKTLSPAVETTISSQSGLSDTTTEERRVTPKKAALLSAVLPGAGQIYNKKYWKLPLVYGAIGTAGFLFVNNRYWYQQYRTAYINDLDTNNALSQFGLQGISTSQLREAADASRKNMEYAAIGFALVYVLQLVDATVDAHLFHFDVTEDLSLNWQPTTFRRSFGTQQYGLALQLNF